MNIYIAAIKAFTKHSIKIAVQGKCIVERPPV